MSNHAGLFHPSADADVVRLIREYPLAWVVSCVEGAFSATLLPLRPVVGANGRVVELLGHFARSNAHVEVVRRNPRVHALFLGPHGYISPSWMKDRTQAPTWTYASARFDLEIELVERSDELDEIVRDLVDAMETGRPGAWHLDEMGARYRRLASAIVGLRARVLAQQVKFKLGQDERPDVLDDILAALGGSAGSEAKVLQEWMQLCNANRESAGP